MRNEHPIWKYISYISTLASVGAVTVGFLTFFLVSLFSIYVNFFENYLRGIVGWASFAFAIAAILGLFLGFVHSLMIAITGTRYVKNKQILYVITCSSIVIVCFIGFRELISELNHFGVSIHNEEGAFLVTIIISIVIGLCLANHFAINTLLSSVNSHKKKRS